MRKQIAIIDCNNFYVSCERAFNPKSIGKPTVVLSNNDGCVIARSQEAKDMGVKMGEPFFKKKEWFQKQGFHIFSSNYNLYGDLSDRVMSVIKQRVKKTEVYSIDECFVDVSNIPKEKLTKFLIDLRSEVMKKTGIPVSIGVGPNKTLSKLTSFIAKRADNFDGVCSYWELDEFERICKVIPISEVWGIGRRWSRKLNKMGVQTIHQFMTMSDFSVRKLFNINGLKTKKELNGLYCHQVDDKFKQKKNITSSRSFGKDISDLEQLSEAMYTYIHNACRKLQDNEQESLYCTIFVSGNKHKDNNHFTKRSVNFETQTDDPELIWAQVFPKLRKMFNKNKTYKKCGILFHGLRPKGVIQQKLFSKPVQKVMKPNSPIKDWEMKRRYVTKNYTSNWSEIPVCY